VVVNTTVVGCGAVAQGLYQQPLRELERRGLLRVTGLVDSQRQHAETLRRSFPHAAVSDDLTSALKSTPSELTLVLSPVRFHPEHTVVALGHNNHVLCEKPMATAESQCDEMIAVARRNSRVLAVGMIRRFFPAFAHLKALLDRQELGELRGFSYQEGKLFDWDVKTPAGFVRQEGGGAGLLFDIGSHVLDSLLWIFGGCQVVSSADDAMAGVESNVSLEVQTPHCRGTVRLSWDSPMKNELRVLGTKGEAVLRVDQFDRLALRGPAGFREVPVTHSYPADAAQPSGRVLSPRLYVQGISCQLVQVVRAIRLGERPAVSGEEGRECVRLIEAARHLARPMEMPWLDPAQREAYQRRHWSNHQ
jgi:predicted dehydrogenase